jgi:FKBP-type peptidyl-prolyl cis-trans isomerase SlyD
MNNKINKYINASYQLYDITDGQNELIEQTSDDQPLSFISGLGLLLEDFEQQLVDLETGGKFNFTLQPEQAYGVYSDDRVVELDKQLFFIDGKFDEANVYQDAIIPLQNEDGNRFMGRVVKVLADKVKIDLNHPLAGRTLNFRGEILENREASNEEVTQFIGQLSGNGGHCGGHCKCREHEHEGECQCGENKHNSECECDGHKHQGKCCGGHHKH